MISAKDIMSRDVVTLAAEMDFAAAAKVLLENHFNGAPVVDDRGRLVGILCQSDLVAQQKRLPVPTLFTLLDSFVQLTSTKQLEKQARKIAALTNIKTPSAGLKIITVVDQPGKIFAMFSINPVMFQRGAILIDWIYI